MSTSLAQQQTDIETQLEEVRAAITKVLAGVQSITNDGETTVYPDISALTIREKMLMNQLDEIERKINRTSSGRVRAAEF